MRRARSVALALVLGLPGGCHGVDRSVSYPDARNPGTVEQVPYRGFAVRVRRVEGGAIEGELLAADEEALWLEDPASKKIARIPTSSVRRVVIPLYRRGPVIGATSVWAGGLLVSTLSHGAWLIITMPIAAAVGGVAIAMTTLESRVVLVPATLNHAWRYARFPQGLPPGWLERRGEIEAELLPDGGGLPPVPPPGSELPDVEGSTAPSEPPALPDAPESSPPFSVDPFEQEAPDQEGSPEETESVEDSSPEMPEEAAAEEASQEVPEDGEKAPADGEKPPIQRPSKSGR